MGHGLAEDLAEDHLEVTLRGRRRAHGRPVGADGAALGGRAEAAAALDAARSLA